jgi:hypothetical protein
MVSGSIHYHQIKKMLGFTQGIHLGGIMVDHGILLGSPRGPLEDPGSPSGGSLGGSPGGSPGTPLGGPPLGSRRNGAPGDHLDSLWRSPKSLEGPSGDPSGVALGDLLGCPWNSPQGDPRSFGHRLFFWGVRRHKRRRSRHMLCLGGLALSPIAHD